MEHGPSLFYGGNITQKIGDGSWKNAQEAQSVSGLGKIYTTETLSMSVCLAGVEGSSVISVDNVRKCFFLRS